MSIGSPPRAWGRRFNLPYQLQVCRFTPTRVGTTSPQALLLHKNAVHPHARGDDAGFYSIFGTWTSLSPSRSTIQRSVAPQNSSSKPCSLLAE